VLTGDWTSTFQQYHPGVTTMWLSGIGLKAFASLRDLSSDQLLGLEPTQPGIITEAVVAGVMPLALAIALCITLCYVLLRRLMDSQVPFVAACLLALDPLYIAYSQVLHVDALLATFMLVSVLFLLNYLHQGKGSDIVLSGVFGGLALLTKTPSLFLVPYTGLAVGGYRLVVHRSGVPIHKGWPRWAGWLWAMGRTVMIWALVATGVSVILWPTMWVQPIEVLRRIGQRIVFHVETPHRNPVFFNGQITLDDAGPLFYLAVIGWKTTLVTLPMTFAGVLSGIQHLGQRKWKLVTWLLVAYVVLFTTQMCLAARKEIAYLLPTFPALDILAAFGLVWTAEAVARARWWRGLRWLPSVIIGAALVLQAGLVLPRHPYYGTLHNRLLGGSRVAQHILPLQDQGEGLDLAAQYLNTLPHAQRATAGLHQRSAAMFRRNFIGLTTNMDDPQVDYRIYYVNQVMRRLEIDTWGALWKADRQADPLWTVAFGSVTYVWIYGVPPAELAPGGSEWAVNRQLGEHIRLERVRLSTDKLVPGNTLTIVLYWRSDGMVESSYKVFCHLMTEDGRLVAQRDGIPLAGVRPTSTWRADEWIEDSYEILLGADLPPGEYKLSVGMYDGDSMKRVPVHDADGNRVPDDHIVLRQVTIEPAPDL